MLEKVNSLVNDFAEHGTITLASLELIGMGTHSGEFNYIQHSAESSLFRNGKVYTERDQDGSDRDFVGVVLEPHTIEVLDARQLRGSERKTCEENGFEVLDAPLGRVDIDFFDHREVLRHYYAECEELVRNSTRGRVFAFDHNVRSVLGKKNRTALKGGQQVQGPAKIVHGDYTLTSAPQRLRDLANPPSANDTLKEHLPHGRSLIEPGLVEEALGADGRFAIINVWRNITDQPVQTNPLAMCDSKSVAVSDLVTFEIRYSDRIGENYFAKHNPNHSFCYFPELTRDEPLLLKQWDSAGLLAQSTGERSDGEGAGLPSTFSFHTAFDDLATPEDAPDRMSIEVRCAVIY